jgi:hypothetical protein
MTSNEQPHPTGLYGKFNVSRTDGTDRPGSKHDGCRYFVLDVTHDKFASAALLAYAKACADEFPDLARDLHALRTAAPIARARTERQESKP